MSKIEDMALKAYPVRHKQNKIGAEYDANYPRRAAFVCGAKAVLEEIEKYMDMQDGCYALECIQMRVRELKGK